MHSKQSKPEMNGEISGMIDSNATRVPSINLFYPMNEFYGGSGVPLPHVVQVQGADMPDPFRTLLVHNGDMTPTLTEAYKREIKLRILNRFSDYFFFF